MAKQMGVAGDVSYTCETAAHFWLLHVLSRWEKFLASAQQLRTDSCVQVRPAMQVFISSILCKSRCRH